MSIEKHFTEAVRAWAEVYMHRSMRDFARFLHTAGISMPQINTLMRLYYQDTCGVSEIGLHLGISNAAASQLIDRMVQQDLLERTECAGDRRIRQLSLTAKGRALVEQAIEARHHWLTKLPGQLTREQQTTLVGGLASLTEAAQRLEETPPVSETRPRKKPVKAPTPGETAPKPL
jgi:DNA-binding MarR family transcriptional regulator